MPLPLDPSDTIAAIASPAGPAPRGLVRLSGPDAIRLASVSFTADEPDSSGLGAWLRPGRLAVVGLRRPVAASIAVWPGPRTYTGQDLVEIHTTGAAPVLGLILADCLTRGARLAEPGEFTLRAFLAGRIDLTQSEAVLGVIDAHTPAQLDAALRQLAGGLATPIRTLRDHLADVVAHLEANLDFVEEADVDLLGRAALATSLDQAATEVESLAARLWGRDRADRRPRVVLVGPPNAGKSRLFNALAGGAPAIVSPRAGTTRDYLEAPCPCDGLTVDLVDTAGLEPAATAIEARAQTARADQAALADLILACQSADLRPVGLSPDHIPYPNQSVLRVWTKADLGPPPDATWLATAATTGLGVDALRASIARSIRHRDADGDLPAGTAARCRESLTRAARSLADAARAIQAGAGDEFVAFDLRQALDDLGQVVGAVATDDLLDRIFGRFCIGK